MTSNDAAGEHHPAHRRPGPAEPLQPSAILRPGDASHGPTGHATAEPGLPAPAMRVHDQDVAPPPGALVRSVGEIAGLPPRRHRGDRGEVAGHDADRVDALDPVAWHAAATWLQSLKTAETRRTYLAALSGFLAWLNTLDAQQRPAGLLAVTEDHLQAYKDDALNGRLRHGVREPGIPAERAAQLYPHMLRSTYITHAFALGIAPDKVQAAARHAGIATTLRYNHPDQDLGGHVAYQLEADFDDA
ncbi:tyrosine-type recombinase/integrase [Nonomuraea sp. NPDC049625]|uniref:tyrosine-type recombinase/integrase n=1 Tax=Nonomuraea sp. NPDC049625 TaxID=3155775 RepID=UPI0034176EA8